MSGDWSWNRDRNRNIGDDSKPGGVSEDGTWTGPHKLAAPRNPSALVSVSMSSVKQAHGAVISPSSGGVRAWSSEEYGAEHPLIRSILPDMNPPLPIHAWEFHLLVLPATQRTYCTGFRGDLPNTR